MNNLFAERLKNARIAKGMTLQQLADKINISKQMISKYEAERSFPTSENLINIAKVLGVNIDYFFRSSLLDASELSVNYSSAVSPKTAGMVEACALEQLEKLFELERILKIEKSPLSTEIIIECRDRANGPICSVVWFLESSGINVIETPDEVKIISAFGYYEGEYPLILINSGLDHEAKRYRLLYELGRIMRIADSCGENDNVLRSFALNMLLPEKVLAKEFGVRRNLITVYELHSAARYFGMSANDVVFRLLEDGVTGWKYNLKSLTDKVEYRDGIFEKPEKLRKLVYKALSLELITCGKAASILNEPISKVKKNTVMGA